MTEEPPPQNAQISRQDSETIVLAGLVMITVLEPVGEPGQVTQLRIAHSLPVIHQLFALEVTGEGNEGVLLGQVVQMARVELNLPSLEQQAIVIGLIDLAEGMGQLNRLGFVKSAADLEEELERVGAPRGDADKAGNGAKIPTVEVEETKGR